MLFFFCVALNIYLIWIFLFQPLRTVVAGLGAGLVRARRYFLRPLSETRERALRRRTLLLLRQLGGVMTGLAAIAVFYAPSILFAHYRSGPGAAFNSPEALAGMLAAAALIGWRGRRP